MIFISSTIIRLLIFIAIRCEAKANPNDWRVIESLAEEHPYIVALLNGAKEYTCTGTIISKRSVLTSGTCIIPKPEYIAVGMAVLGNKSKNSIIAVAFTRLHGDYSFEINAAEPNVIQMHSNLGIVFVVRPVLELFIQAIDVGNYYASELKERKLTVVGYGKLSNSYAIVLQQQDYHQAPCANPKWYYCVCGMEYSKHWHTYELEFGNGGPVLFGSEVVGITATPSGKLYFKTSGTKYNIFTVIGPYLPWIKKSEHETNVETKPTLRAQNNVDNRKKSLNIIYIILFTLLVK